MNPKQLAKNSLASLRHRRNEIIELATRHGAGNVRLFGSITRTDAELCHDIDFLVDFEPNRSLLDLAGLQLDLADLLGQPVDVVVEGGISPYFEKKILSEAIPL